MDEGETSRTELIESAAKQGDAGAQYSLGLVYLTGDGVAVDAAQAVHWFRRSAEQGLASAQSDLGHCYLQGRGVETNPALAIEWFQKAAWQGHAGAQYILGWCYYVGSGVAADKARGVSWLRCAAEHGISPAQLLLAEAHRTGRGVAKDLSQATYWLQRAQAKEPAARRLLRIMRWEARPILRYLQRAMWIAGLALLAYHAATVPFSIRWQAVLFFIAIVLVVSVGSVMVSSLLGINAFDRVPEEHGLMFRRARHTLGLGLQIASEDGLFLVPLLHVGINLPYAVIAGVAFGLAHYPSYSLPMCIPKGIAYILVAMFVLPSGIWSVVAGHIIVDAITFAAEPWFRRQSRGA